MYSVDLYSRVRRACHVEGMSKSEAARVFNIDRKTVGKIPEHSRASGIPAIEASGATEARSFPADHRPDPGGRPEPAEEAAAYGEADLRAVARRAWVHGQADDHHRLPSGEEAPSARGVRAAGASAGPRASRFWRSARRDRRCRAQDPLRRDGRHWERHWSERQCRRRTRTPSPAETTEAFCDGHVSAFAFFGGVPLSILHDNTALAVATILGDGTRKRTRVFSELQSHYLFEDRFGRLGKGNDKGTVRRSGP